MSTTTRNSIIELMRLLASLWVVYYHNMFFVANNTTGYFDSGKIAVDFFFMLSGLFFIKSYNAYKESSLASNFASFTWKRLKGMGVALPIGLVFSTIYFIIFPTNNYGTNFIFGYLWFIPAMFVALLFYFVVFEIKNAKAKTLIVVTIVVACYILAFIFRELRIFSAFAGIGLGILVSIIPKIPLLENKKNRGSCAFIDTDGFVCTFFFFAKNTFVGRTDFDFFAIYKLFVCVQALYS